MNDELGKRMKEDYEERTKLKLPRRTYTIIRIDGKAFHTFTKGFDRPFDKDLSHIMDLTTIELCKAIQGTVLGYTQSDEISLVLADFATITTDAWFDGNVQKICSISASIATAAFNIAVLKHRQDPINHGTGLEKFLNNKGEVKIGLFDCRVFTIPDPIEVENYLIWRQQDASRNSVQMAAQALYSQKELHGKNCSQLQEMIHQKGINWNDYTSGEKRGRAIVKEEVLVSQPLTKDIYRTHWTAYTGSAGSLETPIFTQNRQFLRMLIPKYGDFNDAK